MKKRFFAVLLCLAMTIGNIEPLYAETEDNNTPVIDNNVIIVEDTTNDGDELVALIDEGSAIEDGSVIEEVAENTSLYPEISEDGDTPESGTYTLKLEGNAPINCTVNFPEGVQTTRVKSVGEAFGDLPELTLNCAGNRYYGYKFDGWYTEATGGEKVNSETIATGNTTIYARWISGVFCWIKFSIDSSYSDCENLADARNTVIMDDSSDLYLFPGYKAGDLRNLRVTLSNEFTDKVYSWDKSDGGYEFEGFYVHCPNGDEVELNSETLITQDMVSADNDNNYIYIYARVKPKQYTIGFENSEYSAIQVYLGQVPNWPDAAKVGYDYYWKTNYGQSNFGTTDYYYIAANDIIFKAVYTPKEYTVTYDVNGGDELSESEKTSNITYGKEFGTIVDKTATRTGYTFEGWYSQASGGTKITSTTQYTTAGNTSIYAHWNQKNYTVTFNVNGGNELSDTDKTKSVTYDAAYGELPSTTRTKYDFDGWYTAAAGGSKVTSTDIYTTADNTTLYAHWTGSEHTVTFDANGGNLSESEANKKVRYESQYGSLPTPTKTGYKFEGWFTSSDGGTQIETDSVYNTDGDITLYAHWSVNSYTVTYDLNGANSSDVEGLTQPSKVVTYGTNYGELPVLTRDEYSFEGWYTAAKGGSKITSTTQYTIADNSTLYAHWIGNPYLLTFDVNGGDALAEPSKQVEYGSGYGELPTPTRIGYTFDGWYTAAEGGSKVTSSTKYTTADNSTLYAHWTLEEYTITYNVNGGRNNGTNPAKYTVNTENITLARPTRAGYAFEGWFSDRVMTKEVTVIKKGSTGDKILYAKWTANKYNVEFNGNGATSGSMANMKCVYDKSYTLTKNAYIRSGYSFICWNTKADGTGTTYSNMATISSLTTKNNETKKLYAQWNINTYKITYKLNSGKNNSKNPSNYKVTTSDITLQNPTRTGYTFKGWYTDSKFTKKITVVKKGSTGDKTVYAKWAANKYTIKYNANGGIGSMKNQSMTYDKVSKLTKNSFTRKNYTFLGWSTEKKATKAKYKNQAEVKNLSSKSGGTVTLYAVWKKK